MNYIIAMLLLVSCNLLYFARFCTGSTSKIGNKKHTTKNFCLCDKKIKNNLFFQTISVFRRVSDLFDFGHYNFLELVFPASEQKINL